MEISSSFYIINSMNYICKLNDKNNKTFLTCLIIQILFIILSTFCQIYNSESKNTESPDCIKNILKYNIN